MFDVTSSEFLVIAIVAFLVLGPRRLPELFRKAGAWYGQLQRSAAELRSGLEAELDETAQPLTEIREDLDGVAAAAQEALGEAAGEAEPAPDEENPDEQEEAGDDGEASA